MSNAEDGVTGEGHSDYAARFNFDAAASRLDLDLTDLSLASPRQADQFYDALEKAIGETGRQWFIVTNYEGCDIGPSAAAQFGFRRNLFNAAYSLGSVRYAVPSAMERALLGYSKDPRYDGNVFQTRDEAVARVAELKRN